MNSGGPLDLADLTALAADAAGRRKLRALQAKLRKAVEDAVEETVAILRECAPKSLFSSPGTPVCGSALARASRGVTAEVNARRAHAKLRIAGALLNRKNPDWNPADPSTNRADYDDPLVALLRMNLED